MLQQSDLVLLLTELQNDGVEGTTTLIKNLLTSKKIDLDTIKFINDHRPFEIAQFYEHIRKNHNQKKSSLYKNIVKDVDDVEEVLTTLHAYILQVNLFSKQLENRKLFFKHARAEEVTRVLNRYYAEGDIASALKILRLIKADLVAFETVVGRR